MLETSARRKCLAQHGMGRGCQKGQALRNVHLPIVALQHFRQKLWWRGCDDPASL